MIPARSESAPTPGTLTVATAPAGDAADVTARLRAELAAADLIVAADPRRVRQLAAALGIDLVGRVVSGTDSQPAGCAPDLIAELRAGQNVLLIVDVGAAGASEPGRGLVNAAAAAGIPVTALPGPSPVTAALAIAGMPADRFVVEGSLPGRAEDRNRRFAELAAERRTLIFIESPARLGATLAELAAALGADRPAVVCRALSTAEQDVQRGTLAELAGQLRTGAPGDGASSGVGFSAGDRGASAFGAALLGGDAQIDVTIVVSGAPGSPAGAAAALAEPEALEAALALVQAQVRRGATTRDAVAAIAAQTGLRKRDLYNAVGRSGTSPAPPGRPPGAAG